MPSLNFLLGTASTVSGSGELTQKDHGFKADALLHLEMMILADKYEAPDLLKYAEECLSARLRTESESFWLLIDKLDNLAAPLREQLNKTLIKRAGLNGQSYLRDIRFKNIMMEKPDLAWDIIQCYAKPTNSGGWGGSTGPAW